jgi:serine/threonine protein kinase
MMEDVKTGSHVNRYEIIETVRRSELIGIYKAYDTKLERNVYLKTILHSAEYSQEAVEYFLSESRSLAQMSHPNIAKVLDFGKEDGNLYLISEYVPGTILSEIMTRPMAWQEAVEIILPLTEALAYAHSKGVIHRDLKPDNIIINSDNQPILSDFSLMRIIEEEETRDMTGTNVGLGSPEYISPEQGKGIAVDFRSDIYSLGVIFFEMVTGKKLFYASNSMEIVIQHVMADPPKPRSIVPSLPRSIEEIILNALSKDREKRYQTMDDFADALRAVMDSIKNDKKPKPFLRSPRGLVTVSVIGLIFIAAGTMFMLGISPFGQHDDSIPTLQTASTATPVTNLTDIPPSPTPKATNPTKIPATSTPATSSIYDFPSQPVLPGAALPKSDTTIGPGNTGSLVELARWGTPDIAQFELLDDDQTLLAGTSAGVYYFDVNDLSYKYFFDAGGALTALSVSKDNELVATGDDKGTVAIWNISNGEQVNILDGAGKGVKLLDISPDKSKVVFTDTDNAIHLWNIKQNLHYLFEKRHLLHINSLLFTSDSNRVISGGDDFQIYVWDVPSGKATNKLTADQKVNDLDLSSNDQYLAVSINNTNPTIQVWDLQTGKVINTIIDTSSIIPFNHIVFSPNNQNILTGSTDGFVRIWNAFAPDKIWETPVKEQDGSGNQSPVKTISVARDGTRFAVMFENGLLEIWDLTTHQVETSRDFRYEVINRLTISPNDLLLAFQGGTSFVDILSIANSSQSARVNGTLPRGNPISPDSQMVAIKSGDLTLYSLSATSPRQLYTLYKFPTNGSVSYLTDSSILTAYAGRIMKYWSTSSGLELKPNLVNTDGNCIKYTKRDNSLLTAGSEIGVIYSVDNLQSFCQIVPGPRTTSEKFLPDGSIIALSSENQSFQVWDFRSSNQPKEVKTLSAGSVLDVAISMDGKLLAAASASGTIEIYDLATYELLKTLDLKTGPVNQITFSNNGKYIISGSADGTVRFFGLNP